MITRSAIRIFYSKIIGITDRNRDGSDRQAIAAQCQARERLILARDLERSVKPNAIRVSRLSGEQLGYLPGHRLRRIAQRTARGWRYAAVITELTGGTARRPARGINLAVFVGKRGVSDEVWEAALEAEITPARRIRYLWVALAGLVALGVAWLLAR